MECNERNTMSNLRIIELEQQLKRRDARLAEIETKINNLTRFNPVDARLVWMDVVENGTWLYLDDVLNCFK